VTETHCDAGQAPAPPARSESRRPLAALIGNPNTGKSTLFNLLTGARTRVGNYPGVTVERRVGAMRLDDAGSSERVVDLLDLPGTYSLSARSPEEQIAIDGALGLSDERPDLTIVVVDAGQLVRNLYLVLQLIELEVPIVVALNMIDEVESVPDAAALRELFGVPFVPISAAKKRGLAELTRAIGDALENPPRGQVDVPYCDELLADASAIARSLPSRWRRDGKRGRERALALWAIASIDQDDELRDIDPDLRRACLGLHEQPDRDRDAEIITARYRFLDERLRPLFSTARDERKPRRITERIDRVLLHPVWGFAVFIAVMLTVFQSLFSWSDPAIKLVERSFVWLGDSARRVIPSGVFADLVSDGVIDGVGNVVAFLPQILLLFFFIGLLEDSGYMARAAYLMDRIMRAIGLHGRAFVPMLSGCACAIPAIMATRTMERQRDRLLTMLVIPLMTCSARLPVYTLIIAALFPPSRAFGIVPVQALLMVIMYLFSTAMALAAAGVLGRTVVRGRRIPLLMELPPYRAPAVRNVVRQMLERAASFLKEAGTMILACSIVLWALLSFPREASHHPQVPSAVVEVDAGAQKAARLNASYGAKLGKVIEPAIAPLGFDWRIGVGLIGAFAAREVFVSTMGLVFGIGDADEASQPLREKMRGELKNGKPVYTPLTGLSLMIFFALACQCMSTLAVVRRETKSWRWAAFLFAYMTALAWVMSFLVYQGGKLLGFN
jgi:ferrous iron transport protein B